LIVGPEPGGKVPHKKAEIEMFASRCVANCVLPPPPSASAAQSTSAENDQPNQ
jgi:hypothetical protein